MYKIYCFFALYLFLVFLGIQIDFKYSTLLEKSLWFSTRTALWVESIFEVWFALVSAVRVPLWMCQISMSRGSHENGECLDGHERLRIAWKKVWNSKREVWKKRQKGEIIKKEGKHQNWEGEQRMKGHNQKSSLSIKQGVGEVEKKGKILKKMVDTWTQKWEPHLCRLQRYCG